MALSLSLRARHSWTMKLTVSLERGESGRWLADITELPGAFAEGETAWEASARAQAIALRGIAERLDALDLQPEGLVIEFATAT